MIAVFLTVEQGNYGCLVCVGGGVCRAVCGAIWHWWRHDYCASPRVDFTAYGYSPEVVAHLAVGTSLATIIITSISSLTAHHKQGGVRWDVWKHMAGGLVVGSLLGAAVADQISGQVLQVMIGVAAATRCPKNVVFIQQGKDG